MKVCLCLLFLAAGMVFAQSSRKAPPSPNSLPSVPSLPSDREQNATLTIRVLLPNDRPLDDVQVRVRLLGPGGTPMDDRFTDSHAQVSFGPLVFGQYQVLVSGLGIEETRSGLIDVSESRHTEFVSVKLQSASPTSAESTVSANALSVPPKAYKEFEKGNQEAKRQRWDLAEPHYRKAIEIYPEFAAAHHNLGLACVQHGNYVCARDAWERAIQLDPGTAGPFINLARLRTRERDYPGAEALLKKAVSLQPLNPESMVLLANAELMQGRYEQALADARQGISLSGQVDGGRTVTRTVSPQVLLAHMIAGNALEAQHRPDEAVGEYEAILKASPEGPAADQAQKALTRLRQLPVDNK